MARKSKQKKELIKERVAKERRERNNRRKEEEYIAWNHLSRNEKEVAKRVLAGKYRHLQPGSWGFPDRFFIFLKSIDFFTTLDVDGKGFQRKMITIANLPAAGRATAYLQCQSPFGYSQYKPGTQFTLW